MAPCRALGPAGSGGAGVFAQKVAIGPRKKKNGLPGGAGSGGDRLFTATIRGILGSQYPGIRDGAGRAGTVLHARGTERRFGLTYIEQK